MSTLPSLFWAFARTVCSVVVLALPLSTLALLPESGDKPVPVDQLRVKVLDTAGATSTGAFQIATRNQTYTLCQSRKYFNKQGANLACKHAGFAGGGFRLGEDEVLNYKSLQPVASLPVFTCTDADTSLAQCTSGPQLSIGAELPDKDLVILKCYSEGAVRLVDGPTPNQGRLQIFLNGTWYNVCSDYIRAKGATALAACRLAGYPSNFTNTVDASTFDPNKLRYSQPSVYLPYVSCLNDEPLITACNMGGVRPVAFFTDDKCYDANADAALVCQAEAPAINSTPPAKPSAAAPAVASSAVLGGVLAVVVLVMSLVL